MKCIFTGKDTNSSEHVIPRWLQARFGLAEQDLIVPNGTRLKYKHHRVPADRDANNQSIRRDRGSCVARGTGST